jgi:hypothetical protein
MFCCCEVVVVVVVVFSVSLLPRLVRGLEVDLADMVVWGTGSRSGFHETVARPKKRKKGIFRIVPFGKKNHEVVREILCFGFECASKLF